MSRRNRRPCTRCDNRTRHQSGTCLACRGGGIPEVERESHTTIRVGSWYLTTGQAVELAHRIADCVDSKHQETTT